MGLPKIAIPEYSLKLPSSGKEIKYRPFLVKEEKLLLIAMESEDDKQIITATKNVLRSCIFDDVNVDEMPIFDIEYVFLWLRGKAKGEKLELKYSCPKCETILQVDLNLEDIKVQKQDEHNPKIEITDSVGIIMKYPNMEMQSKIELLGETNDIETLFESIRLCIDYIYDNETIYANKDHTKKELDDFIESLTEDSFKKLSKFFETMPKLKHTINLKCAGQPAVGKKKKNNCDYTEEMVLEGISSFFD
jgi:hypothetical protein